MNEFNLVSIIANDYDLLKKKFCGNVNKLVIKNSSESIEDIYHNQLLNLLETLPDHSDLDYQTEFDFILSELRAKTIKENKQVPTVEYSDNYENYPVQTESECYDNRMKLLLIHYPTNGKNKKGSKTKV
jgi:hypothetical protein